MVDKDGNIDFGSWTVPSSWDDITLKQFSEIEKYYSDKDKDFDAREVMHILCDKSIDEVNALPMDFSEEIMKKLMFLSEKPEEKEPSNRIKVNGEEYIINVAEKLKTGEYIAVDTVLKSDRHNTAAVLGILCRKKGEIYDSKFENEVLQDRIKMWEEQSVVDILPLISFFLQCYMVSQTPTLLSLELREGINHIRKDIEISVKNGETSKRSMKSVMRKLKKLEKSINSI